MILRTKAAVCVLAATLIALAAPASGQAAASGDCGTGVNYDRIVAQGEEVAGPFGGKVKRLDTVRVLRDKCEAEALAEKLKTQADTVAASDAATVVGAGAWAAVASVRQAWKPAAAIAAYLNTVVVVGAKLASTRLKVVAGNISEAVKRCASRGIAFTAGPDSFWGWTFSDFACQPPNNKDLDPDLSDLVPVTIEGEVKPQAVDTDDSAKCSTDPLPLRQPGLLAGRHLQRDNDRHVHRHHLQPLRHVGLEPRVG